MTAPMPQAGPWGWCIATSPPGNVLLSWEGAVKLADFGLAKAYAGTKPGDSDAYGTPGYMSPEQVGGGHQMDRRSDLFAAGVVLYELLTRTRPFVGVDRIELDLAILRQQIAPPRALRPEIPADLDAITMQLLERDPARRPAGADAVIEALEGCAAALHRGRGALMDLLRALPCLWRPGRTGSAQDQARDGAGRGAGGYLVG